MRRVVRDATCVQKGRAEGERRRGEQKGRVEEIKQKYESLEKLVHLKG
jgi:hypothetical protein